MKLQNKEQKKEDKKDSVAVTEKVEEKSLPDKAGQNPESESFQTWPMENVLDRESYLGTDSTAVQEITILYTKQEKNDPNVELVNSWFEKLISSDVDVDHEINVGIELAREVSAAYNQYYDLSQMPLAGQMILNGCNLSH